MPISSLEGLSNAQKEELVASLSAIVVGTSGVDVTAQALNAVAEASGNTLSQSWASVFANVVAKSGGIEKFCLAPGGGGGGGGGGESPSSGGEVAAAKEPEPEEEEAPPAVDMFGGGDGGGGDY